MPTKEPVVGQNYSIAEFSEAMRCSVSYVYLEISRGRLHAVKLGNRTIVTASEKSRYESALVPLVSRASVRATGRSA
jgi:hypothetical protein